MPSGLQRLWFGVQSLHEPMLQLCVPVHWVLVMLPFGSQECARFWFIASHHAVPGVHALVHVAFSQWPLVPHIWPAIHAPFAPQLSIPLLAALQRIAPSVHMPDVPESDPPPEVDASPGEPATSRRTLQEAGAIKTISASA
jgi:hypothetical protein